MTRTLAALFAVSLSLATLVAQASDSPAGTIDHLQNALIESMKNGPKLGCTGRIEKLGPVVDMDFDLPYLAQQVIRRHWKDLSEEQHAQFIDTFRELVVGTYAAEFKKFAGESFKTSDTQDLSSGAKLVHAKLTTSDGKVISFDYVLHQVDGNWKLVNVVADGVSDLALRSSQYDQSFKAGGFEGLITTLKKQIAGNKKDC